MSEINVTDFLQENLPSYAAYDNLRKLGNFCDGMKLSTRKIIFTLLDKIQGKEKTKTDTVANLCAAYTNYLHGAANLCGVCDTLAQSFVGANNYPLLDGNSSGFGTRINPVCAAPRYTKVAAGKILEYLLNKDDLEIVEKQYFEGSYIEPKFFVPIFPILFLNGSHGVSIGYAQDIYPRNPEEVIRYIKCKLNEKKFSDDLLPWFKGFTGSVTYNNETEKIECFGNIEKVNTTSYTITELPIGIEYDKYIAFLDKLCEDGTIVDYTDNCDTKTDNIRFEIKTTREFSKKYDTKESLYKVFKLVKSLSENYSCINKENEVTEYNNVFEILDDFINIRLIYYQRRKEYQIKKINDKLDIFNSKYAFCDSVINGTIKIAKVKKSEIIKELASFNSIKEKDGSYDYLLNMPIHSISMDTLNSLKEDIKKQKELLKVIKCKDIKDMWIEDLDNLKTAIKNF